MTEYDDQLKALREKLSRKEKVQRMLASLEAQAADLQEEVRELDEIRLKEQADVERLERRSLSALIFSALNMKEERLDKEKAEALAAAAKYQAALRQAQAVEGEIRSLEAELAGLSGVEAAYERVFEQKMAALRKSNSHHAEEIGRMEATLMKIAAERREIDEALSVGYAALEEISQIQDSLDSAEGWGVWDLAGGGLISSMAKHARLDEAQDQITQLQMTLRRYRTELADVTIHADIQAQVEGFLRFADHFFDGLFVDWAVLDSIHDAQRDIARTRHQVEGVQSRLRERRASLDEHEERLKKDLESLVLSA